MSMPVPNGISDLWLFISMGSRFIADMFAKFFSMFGENIFLMFPLIMVIVAMGVLAVFRVVSS